MAAPRTSWKLFYLCERKIKNFCPLLPLFLLARCHCFEVKNDLEPPFKEIAKLRFFITKLRI